MSKVVIKLKKAGVRAYLKSESVSMLVEDYAREIADRAGEGYTHDVHIGRNRANASVFPSTEAGEQENFENNTLLKSMGGG